MIDPDFIKRCNEMAKPIADEIESTFRNKHRIQMNIYNRTENKRISQQKCDTRRRKVYREAKELLTWEEIENINDFYQNCPEGYEVDHIQPISRGGKHTLSNLQYLTKEENMKKMCTWKPWEQYE